MKVPKTNRRLELGLFHTSKRDELVVGIKWCKTESPKNIQSSRNRVVSCACQFAQKWMILTVIASNTAISSFHTL